MRPTIIKFGGSVFTNARARKKFLKELVLWSKRRPTVLVHGGGAEITELLKAWGIRTRFVRGLRYTDAKTMEAVEMVLSAKVNKSLVRELWRYGAKAIGLSGVDGGLVVAKKDKKLGFVGVPSRLRPQVLQVLLENHFLPVVSPVSLSARGERLNVNADVMAGALACSLKARQYVTLTDVPGVLDPQGQRIPVIRRSQISSLVRKKIVQGGMIPKLEAARAAMAQGVGEVDIIDGRTGIKVLRGTRILP